RETLAELPVVAPGIVPQPAQALGGVPERELIRRETRPELVPRDRHRHRAARACPRRVRGDRRAAAVVAKVVEQDLVLAPALGERRRVAPRLLALDRRRDPARE